MRAIICDDDKRFAKELERQVLQVYRHMGINVEIIVFSDPVALVKSKDLAMVDIAFLDAEMTPMDGIEVGHILKKQNPTIIVVYVSAYLEFAPQGYTVEAFRYLLKQDISKTLTLCLTDILEELSPAHAVLSYKQSGEVFRIPCREILYIQSNLRKLNVFGQDPLTPVTSFYGKIADYAELLLPSGFLQINKSTLVNMQYIIRIASYKVVLSNNIVMNTSRKDYPVIKNKYIEWRGKL